MEHYILSDGFQQLLYRLSSQESPFGRHVISHGYHRDAVRYVNFRRCWVALAQQHQNERAIADVAVFEMYHEVS